MSYLLLFTNQGRVHRISITDLGVGGSSISDSIEHYLGDLGEHICQILHIHSYDDAPYLLLATRLGRVKKTRLTGFDTPRPGVIALNLDEDDELIGATLCAPEDELLLITADGSYLRTWLDDEALQPAGRSSAASPCMPLGTGDYLVSIIRLAGALKGMDA